ncbi:MAG: ketopantoate reductase family protein [Clostridiales bacterium]|nr:ketopantoate reductase family protein [Clostridiales bacterium]
MNKIKTVGLIGLGAVGALYAERMLALGADLRVIVDESRKERYSREGVYVNGVRVDFPYVTPDEAKTVDLLLIVTKEGGLLGAMETAADFVGENTQIISLLNGVTSEGIVAQRFGGENVLYSVAQGMDAVKEGSCLTYVHPGQIVLGEKEPGAISARVQMVADFLNDHGVKCTPVGDMVRRQWGKLMLNVGLNQACMVFECDYGGVQQPGRARETMLGAMREAQMMAGLEGHAISEAEFEEWVALLDSFAPAGKPSMRQDGEARRKSEVELFAGTMLRLGEKHGVELPVNRWLYDRIKEMEAAY